MTVRKLSPLVLVGILALALGVSSCSPKDHGESPQEQGVTLKVVSDINTLKASETAWDVGDKIGIYVVESGKGLVAANIYQDASNLSYVTSNGDGKFISTTGIELPLVEGKRVDVISYYPHQAVGADYKTHLDISDQSDLSKLDLLYSSNAKAIDSRAPRANLVFDHVMSQLQLNVLGGAGLDLSGLKVRIDGLVTDGLFDLATGTVASLGTITKEVTAYSEGGVLQRVILIPGQKLDELKLTFEVGGKSYVYSELPQKVMQAGVRERFTFQIGDGKVMLINSAIEVIGKGDEGSIPGIEVPEGNSNTASYMEQVLIKDGYMTDMLFAQHDAPDSAFGGGTTPGGQRRNYTVYYSKNNRQPYMIAYPLYRDCTVKNVDRRDDWNWDPKIATQYQQNLFKSYQGGIYSRGHMLASAHRLASRELNSSTFYFTNMVPQDSKQNAGVWAQLETAERNWVENSVDTLFVVCGPSFDEDRGTVGDGVGQPVRIPSHTWKVFLKKVGNQYKSIATKMPNTPTATGWKNYVMSVADLEKELGVTFFSKLDPAIADQVKSQKNSSEW